MDESAAGGTYDVRLRGCVAIVTTPARISAQNAQQFWAALAEVSSRHAVIVADMSATTYWDHTAFHPLLMALRLTDVGGGELRVVAHSKLAESLGAAGYARLVPVFRTVAEAVDAPGPLPRWR